MYKKFWQSIFLGIAGILLIVALRFILRGMELSDTILYITIVAIAVLYMIYLKTVIESYHKYIEEKEKNKKKKTEVKTVVKPIVEKIEMPKLQPFKKIKPVKKVVKEIKPTVVPIKVPSEDLSLMKLVDYIKYNLYYGQDSIKIRDKLLSVGWSKDIIDKAFTEVGVVRPVGLLVVKKERVKDVHLKEKVEKLEEELEDERSKPPKVIVKRETIVKKKKKVTPKKSYSHRFVASIDDGKYHRYNCPWVKMIEKKKYFDSQREALDGGWKKCAVCLGDKNKKKKSKPRKKHALEFVASKDGGKYHNHACHLGKAISRSHRIYFKSKISAKNAGYKPCGICIKG